MGFWGVNVWSRDFLGSLEAVGIFGVLIFAPIRSSPSLEIQSTPWEAGVPGCSMFMIFRGDRNDIIYQDEHAPIKFMTGVLLKIIMGSTLRTAAI